MCSSYKNEKSHSGGNKETQEYEKSNENFIRPLSLLYAGGVIGKVKYMQGRSALVMRHTGKSTKTGTPSKQGITFGFGIPIPRALSYKDLMQNISQIDIGELISVKTPCVPLYPKNRELLVCTEILKQCSSL